MWRDAVLLLAACGFPVVKTKPFHSKHPTAKDEECNGEVMPVVLRSFDGH